MSKWSLEYYSRPAQSSKNQAMPRLRKELEYVKILYKDKVFGVTLSLEFWRMVQRDKGTYDYLLCTLRDGMKKFKQIHPIDVPLP